MRDGQGGDTGFGNGHGRPRLLVLGLLILAAAADARAQDLPYEAMAARIVAALRPARGERVLLRFDPESLPALVPAVQAALETGGAEVEALAYGPVPDFADRLADTDIYIWLSASSTAVIPPDQVTALARWLDAGRGRQIHFHWGDGTRDADGLNARHTAAYDRVYVDALDVDSAALKAAMASRIERLRRAEIRVTTPAGTDLRFRLGDRPVTTQDGDASREKMKDARVRIDREIELPAGALRVAPVEASVVGVIVLPTARFSGTRARNVRLRFEEGKVVEASASEGQAALDAFLASAPGASWFREFALGVNPRLVTPDGETAIAYYGYGAGVVRLSLGDNEELGGAVRGGGVRWLLFPDATVTVGEDLVVDRGRLR